MGGKHGAKDVEILQEIASDYSKQGAEAIIMGCTEIPLAINQSHIDIQLFDTTQIIAESAVNFSLG